MILRGILLRVPLLLPPIRYRRVSDTWRQFLVPPASILGHQSIRVTEKHYAPFVKARQEQLEDDVRRTWTPEKKRARMGHVKLSRSGNRQKANKKWEFSGAGGGNRTAYGPSEHASY